MNTERLEKIIERFNKQGKMAFLEGVSDEQLSAFETEQSVKLPEGYKEWLKFSDGGECFLPAGVQFYGVAHMPKIDVDDAGKPGEKYIIIGALATGDPILCEKGSERISIYNREGNCIEDDEVYDDFEAFLNGLYELLGLGD